MSARNGGTLVVAGPSGAGKSHLIAQLGRRKRFRVLDVLTVRASLLENETQERLLYERVGCHWEGPRGHLTEALVTEIRSEPERLAAYYVWLAEAAIPAFLDEIAKSPEDLFVVELVSPVASLWPLASTVVALNSQAWVIERRLMEKEGSTRDQARHFRVTQEAATDLLSQKGTAFLAPTLSLDTSLPIDSLSLSRVMELLATC